ncbi:hypothetical protein EDD18DRAFT_1107697 [Armillaria luteobubalina]|uniref:Uncharacterized protein n=1 Tax=Armillaria luteobubalina TaxID=153913 RepID=A0AA39PZY4_9AGAR|nr:hypothetical protein EDD18DRAFT_1107697 [Armillaria luteobubalina]
MKQKRVHDNFYVATIGIVNEDEAVDLCQASSSTYTPILYLVTIFNRQAYPRITRIHSACGTLAESVADVEGELNEYVLVDTFTNIKLIWARSFPRREGPEGIVRQTYLPSTSYYTVVEGPVPACTSRPLQRFHPPHILVALVCMLGTKTYIELTRAYIPSTGHATSVDIAGYRPHFQQECQGKEVRCDVLEDLNVSDGGFAEPSRECNKFRTDKGNFIFAVAPNEDDDVADHLKGVQSGSIDLDARNAACIGKSRHAGHGTRTAPFLDMGYLAYVIRTGRPVPCDYGCNHEIKTTVVIPIATLFFLIGRTFRWALTLSCKFCDFCHDPAAEEEYQGDGVGPRVFPSQGAVCVYVREVQMCYMTPCPEEGYALGRRSGHFWKDARRVEIPDTPFKYKEVEIQKPWQG